MQIVKFFIYTALVALAAQPSFAQDIPSSTDASRVEEQQISPTPEDEDSLDLQLQSNDIAPEILAPDGAERFEFILTRVQTH